MTWAVAGAYAALMSASEKVVNCELVDHWYSEVSLQVRWCTREKILLLTGGHLAVDVDVGCNRSGASVTRSTDSLAIIRRLLESTRGDVGEEFYGRVLLTGCVSAT